MLGRSVGLVEFVEQAHDLTRLDVLGLAEATEAADAVIRYVLCGAFRRACFFVEYPEELFPDHMVLEISLRRWENWWAFAESVHLTGFLDDFLAVMESDSRTATLARECRDELDLLLVLADLCEDNAMPRAAEESRYLHTLLLSACRDLWATRINAALPPLQDEDDGEGEGDSEME